MLKKKVLMIDQINYLEDSVSNCHSIMFQLTLSQYLKIIDKAYTNDGNINGQRTTLKSQSAKKIRERMTIDFKNGSVLPPVVIGLADTSFDNNILTNKEALVKYLQDVKESISIIDGMQRTTAFKNAGDAYFDRTIRLELWITGTISKLIYRMLVLNTGQVPWTMKRQLEVVLYPIMKRIQEKIPKIKLINSNDEMRRSAPGQFQADKIIESFLVFGARSEKANTRDAIAEEYTRMDFIESSSKQELLDIYIEFLRRIIKLDCQLARIQVSEENTGKFKRGLDLFTSQPVLIGVTTAFAIKILGRPKRDYTAERQSQNLQKIMTNFDQFLMKLEQMDPDTLSKYFNIESLNYMSPSATSTKIGDVERAFFKDSFHVLIQEDFEIENMDICWGH